MDPQTSPRTRTTGAPAAASHHSVHPWTARKTHLRSPWRHAALFAALPLCLASSKGASGGFNTGLRIDYFGQTPPGETPAIFAPDFISRPELVVQNCCFSADGREFVFVVTDSTWSKSTVMYTRFADGKWAVPAPLDLGRISGYTPCFSPDGSMLYFTSRIEKGRDLGHIFAAHRIAGAWGPAEQLPAPVNSDTREWEVSVAPNGNLYFSSGREGGYGGLDIYRARLVDGKFANPECLPAPVNGVSNDECPFMAPDESYLVFNSWKYNPRFRGNNLYVSFKRPGGGWSEPAELPAGINTDELDIYPYVTPDGKYLMFTRREFASAASFSRLYWVSTSVLDKLRSPLLAHPAGPAASARPIARYVGTYVAASGNAKLAIGTTKTLAGEVLTMHVQGNPDGPQPMEAIGGDEFWIPGARLQFNPDGGQLRVAAETKAAGQEYVFQRQP